MNRTITYRLSVTLSLALMAVILGAAIQEGRKCRFWPGVRALYPLPFRWESLSEGFDRTVLKFNGRTLGHEPPRNYIKRRVEVLVFRIDTARFPLRVMTARGLFGTKKAKLSKVHEKTGALLTINGGYFSGTGDPMGMVISDGELRNPWSEEGGSGAIAMFGSVLRIDWIKKITEAAPPPQQALQNGPLIVEPGGEWGMIHRRDKYFPRTVVALDKSGKLLVAVTRKLYREENSGGINLYEAAAILYNTEKIGGLEAFVAMNLDGGTSTGMQLTLGDHHDRIPVNIGLPTFICIMPPP